MKHSTATKPRLSMVVKLYKNDKLVHYTTKRVKSRILDFVLGKPVSEWDTGYFRVTYNTSESYFNHAYFEDFAKLQRIVSEFTEWDLVRRFI